MCTAALQDLQTKIKAQETTLLADNTTLRETLEKHVRQAALEAERNAQALNMKDLELQLAQTQLKQKVRLACSVCMRGLQGAKEQRGHQQACKCCIAMRCVHLSLFTHEAKA